MTELYRPRGLRARCTLRVRRTLLRILVAKLQLEREDWQHIAQEKNAAEGLVTATIDEPRGGKAQLGAQRATDKGFDLSVVDRAQLERQCFGDLAGERGGVAAIGQPGGKPFRDTQGTQLGDQQFAGEEIPVEKAGQPLPDPILVCWHD